MPLGNIPMPDLRRERLEHEERPGEFNQSMLTLACSLSAGVSYSIFKSSGYSCTNRSFSESADQLLLFISALSQSFPL
jgi:hypothetical protein